MVPDFPSLDGARLGQPQEESAGKVEGRSEVAALTHSEVRCRTGVVIAHLYCL